MRNSGSRWPATRLRSRIILVRAFLISAVISSAFLLSATQLAYSLVEIRQSPTGNDKLNLVLTSTENQLCAGGRSAIVFGPNVNTDPRVLVTQSSDSEKTNIAIAGSSGAILSGNWSLMAENGTASTFNASLELPTVNGSINHLELSNFTRSNLPNDKDSASGMESKDVQGSIDVRVVNEINGSIVYNQTNDSVVSFKKPLTATVVISKEKQKDPEEADDSSPAEANNSNQQLLKFYGMADTTDCQKFDRTGKLRSSYGAEVLTSNQTVTAGSSPEIDELDEGNGVITLPENEGEMDLPQLPNPFR